MRSIELFAGAAGLGMGLAKAGFKHEIVVERDHQACETIRHNQKRGFDLVRDWKIVEADVQDVDLSAIKAEPDLLSGGPPCQPFSIGGSHSGDQDERNCWPWTINATKTLKPRSFVFENVPGLMRYRDYLDYIILALSYPELANPQADWQEDLAFLKKCLDQKTMHTLRYKVKVEKYTATDYGVAQARSRLFIIGLREDIQKEWQGPKPSHSQEQLLEDKWISGVYWDRHGLTRPDFDEQGLRFLRQHNRKTHDLFAPRLEAHKTVRDAIADLPEATDKEACGFHNHIRAAREAKAYKGHTGSPVDEPSKTLRAGVHGVSGGENMIDYGPSFEGNRYRHYTVREAARVMGVDDNYVFPGTWSDGLKQMGNAVCPPMAESIGKQLHKTLQAL
jgi:DNA (cytosine-5)-methyltransferase 1